MHSNLVANTIFSPVQTLKQDFTSPLFRIAPIAWNLYSSTHDVLRRVMKVTTR